MEKCVLSKGIGITFPAVNDLCKVLITCDECSDLDLPGTLEYNVPHEVMVDVFETPLEEHIHSCIKSMLEGEKCTLAIKSSIQGGGVGDIIIIELISIVPCNFWEFQPSEKLEIAQQHKRNGTSSFKNKSIDIAFKQFRQAAKCLISIGNIENMPAELVEDCKILYTQVFLNLAICQIQHKFYAGAVSNCSKVLLIDGQNIKALYRRATSYHKLKLYAEAKEDLIAARNIEPKNTAVEKLLNDVNKCIIHGDTKLASAMSKLFT